MPTFTQVAKLTLQRDALVAALQRCVPYIQQRADEALAGNWPRSRAAHLDVLMQSLQALDGCNERVFPIESLEEFIAVGKACGVENIGDLEPRLSQSLRDTEDDETHGIHPTIAQALRPFVGRMLG